MPLSSEESSFTLNNCLLGWYTFVHVQSLYSCCRGLPTWAEMVGLKSDEVSDKDVGSPRQNHMLGCLRGFNAACLYLSVKAWQTKDVFLRDQLIVAEGIMFAITGIDAYKLGVTKFLVAYVTPALLSAVSVLGVSWKGGEKI